MMWLLVFIQFFISIQQFFVVNDERNYYIYQKEINEIYELNVLKLRYISRHKTSKSTSKVYKDPSV